MRDPDDDGRPVRVGILAYGTDRPGSGIARYTTELITALRRRRSDIDVVVLVPGHSLAGIGPSAKVVGLRRLPALMTVGPVAIAAVARRHRLDVVHDPAGVSPFLVPRRAAPFARVVTIHDMVPYVYPETHARLTNVLFHEYIPRSLWAVDRLVTVSEASRRDIARFWNVPPERLEVIPNGVGAHFAPRSAAQVRSVLERLGVSPPYVLAVGAIQPRKNLETLFDAFAQLRAGGLPHTLVVVGRQMWKSHGVFRRLEELGLADAVTLTGFVEDDDLPALYAGAACFVFPSLYEGFGLPPLEAMACGAPVVASDCSSMPEVLGDAGVLAPAHDSAAFASAIRRIIADPGWANELRRRGTERAAVFGWDRTAAAHAQLYRELRDGEKGRTGLPTTSQVIPDPQRRSMVNMRDGYRRFHQVSVLLA